tara:strand:+ start:458 stop:838 length:381 start_codon:yes stop_codon:yes gene_type:complete
MIHSVLTELLNFVHILILLTPIVIYWLPRKIMKIYAKYILLVAALIPLHWVFFDDYCAFTVVSQKMGDYEDAETTSAFSENNLKWLYQPIMRLFGWKWDSQGLDKMVTLHWIFNILLIWYFCFFKV